VSPPYSFQQDFKTGLKRGPKMPGLKVRRRRREVFEVRGDRGVRHRLGRRRSLGIASGFIQRRPDQIIADLALPGLTRSDAR
jgi:hypothetical protein